MPGARGYKEFAVCGALRTRSAAAQFFIAARSLSRAIGAVRCDLRWFGSVPLYLYVSRMRKLIILTAFILIIAPIIALHLYYVRLIKRDGITWTYTSAGNPCTYSITSIYPSGFKFIDYHPEGDNMIDIGIGIIKLPLIRYTVVYTADNGEGSGHFGRNVESHRFMSYVPMKMSSYY